jgi:hypothetical protein
MKGRLAIKTLKAINRTYFKAIIDSIRRKDN